MSVAPIPRICWPFVIVSGVNDTLKVTTPLLNSGSPIVATIADDSTGTIYPTPESLTTAAATALQSAIRAAPGAAGTETVTMPVGFNGITSIVITCPNGTGAFTLKWSLAPGLGILLGYADAIAGTDQLLTLVSGFTAEQDIGNSDYQVHNFWYPAVPVRTDPRERSTYPRSMVETPGCVVAVDLASAVVRHTIAFENLAPGKTLISQEAANSAVNQALERLFVAGTGGYAQFRWYDDATNLSAWETYALREKTAQQFTATRMYDTLELYKVSIEMTTTT